MSRKSENHETSEGLGIKFLSVICHFKNFSVYIKKMGSFYKNFKNCAGDKLNLLKLESPTGIGRVSMSVIFHILILYFEVVKIDF